MKQILPMHCCVLRRVSSLCKYTEVSFSAGSTAWQIIDVFCAIETDWYIKSWNWENWVLFCLCYGSWIIPIICTASVFLSVRKRCQLLIVPLYLWYCSSAWKSQGGLQGWCSGLRRRRAEILSFIEAALTTGNVSLICLGFLRQCHEWKHSQGLSV